MEQMLNTRHTETGGKMSPLSAQTLRKIDAYWRAANYLSVGQIYLLDNPLLTQPLTLEHVKPWLLGHSVVQTETRRSLYHATYA